MQTAVWWYRDIWSGTSNISQAAKILLLMDVILTQLMLKFIT